MDKYNKQQEADSLLHKKLYLKKVIPKICSKFQNPRCISMEDGNGQKLYLQIK